MTKLRFRCFEKQLKRLGYALNLGSNIVMNDLSHSQSRRVRSLIDEDFDEIVDQMLSTIRTFVNEKFDANTKLRVQDLAIEKQVRTALFDCLASYAQFQFFDPQEDLYTTARNAKVAAGILKKIQILISEVPSSSKDWYARHAGEMNPFSGAFEASLKSAEAFFRDRSRPPRGKKMNYPIYLAVEPAIKAVETTLGRKIRRVLLTAKDHEDSFVDLDAKLIARILTTIDGSIRSEQVKTALQRYFSDHKLK